MAKKRRGNLDGNMYRRKDGRWVAPVRLADGTRKHFYGKTRQAAQASCQGRTGRLAWTRAYSVVSV